MLKTLLFLWIALASSVWAVEGAAERRFTQVKAASAGVREGSGWERYKARGEEFSALLPEVPSTCTILRPVLENDSGKVMEGRGFSSYADDAVFVVMSFDNVKAKEPLQTFVNEFGSYGVIHSQLIFSHDVVLDNFAGKQFLLKAEHAHGVVQFYLTDKHVYVFAAIVGRDENDSAIQRFLKSLAFNDKNKSSDIYQSKRAIAAATATSPVTASAGSANQNPNLPVAFNPQEVTSPAIIVTMPQPPYTDQARQQFITGTVILRGVLSANGQVTNLRATKGLPFGLTEQALIAAQALKFFPALKDGRRVSQYVQMEYKFDLY